MGFYLPWALECGGCVSVWWVLWGGLFFGGIFSAFCFWIAPYWVLFDALTLLWETFLSSHLLEYTNNAKLPWKIWCTGWKGKKKEGCIFVLWCYLPYSSYIYIGWKRKCTLWVLLLVVILRNMKIRGKNLLSLLNTTAHWFLPWLRVHRLLSASSGWAACSVVKGHIHAERSLNYSWIQLTYRSVTGCVIVQLIMRL